MNTIFENSRTENNAEAVRSFFRSVYSYMFAALGISGIIAYRVGNDPNLFSEYFLNGTGGLSASFYLVLFAPIGLSFLIQWGYNRLSMLSLTF
ncbi:MAG: hypothetical protein ISP69_07035, partial [Crocinitomicaceae bacterium]|nr:hypothetical protein [Crocinitomicaceae bacterium]